MYSVSTYSKGASLSRMVGVLTELLKPPEDGKLYSRIRCFKVSFGVMCIIFSVLHVYCINICIFKL